MSPDPVSVPPVSVPVCLPAFTLLLLSGCVPKSQPPVDPDLKRLLAYYDRHYDAGEQMLCIPFASPGYHSGIASGRRTHPTRESLVYALALLQRNGRGDATRAAGTIRKVIFLQDTQPSSETYGTWPWLLEEPIQQMPSPDMNWADFCGMTLAHIMVEHRDQLPRTLYRSIRSSLRHAAHSIRKRDVGPGYTNIAILGGGVCAVAGELLDDSELLAYGRRRLQEVAEHTKTSGSFSEYNSPPYAKVVIAECERTLQLVRDEAIREAAESLRVAAWQLVAESFHPPTQQWAGPHARTSRERLRGSTVEFLSRRVGFRIRTHPAMSSGEPRGYAVVRPIPCPEHLVEEFRRLSETPRQLKRTFIRQASEDDSTTGTTWLSQDACLGTVNRSSFWMQRKPLIGYWRTDDDPAVVSRVRFLHDGKDFASMGLRTAQDGPRALSVFHSLPSRGDWHRTLDRPANGVFQAKDFRVRYELRGANVGAKELGGGRFSLYAGDHHVVVYTVPGHFDGQRVQWKIGLDSYSAFLDGICYQGPRRAFDFRGGIDVRLAAGIELLKAREPTAVHSPKVSCETANRVQAEWQIEAGQSLSVEFER